LVPQTPAEERWAQLVKIFDERPLTAPERAELLELLQTGDRPLCNAWVLIYAEAGRHEAEKMTSALACALRHRDEGLIESLIVSGGIPARLGAATDICTPECLRDFCGSTEDFVQLTSFLPSLLQPYLPEPDPQSAWRPTFDAILRGLSRGTDALAVHGLLKWLLQIIRRAEELVYPLDNRDFIQLFEAVTAHAAQFPEQYAPILAAIAGRFAVVRARLEELQKVAQQFNFRLLERVATFNVSPCLHGLGVFADGRVLVNTGYRLSILDARNNTQQRFPDSDPLRGRLLPDSLDGVTVTTEQRVIGTHAGQEQYLIEFDLANEKTTYRRRRLREEDCHQPGKLVEMPQGDLLVQCNDGSLARFDRHSGLRRAFNPLHSVYANPHPPPVVLSSELVAAVTGGKLLVLTAQNLQIKTAISFTGQFFPNGCEGLTALPNGYVVLTGRYSEKLFVVDPASGLVVAQIKLPFGPQDVIYNHILHLLVIVHNEMVYFYKFDHADLATAHP
jgi:hypothetical protein